MTVPWLTLIGIGEDGLDGLSPQARRLVAAATFVVGGRRHLELLGPVAAETMAWPSPLTDALPKILARRGRPTLVLASGDPFFWGVGSLLARHVPVGEIASHPAPSAFSLAANRLGWTIQDTTLVSLHGRALASLWPRLQPRARILALSWDGGTPGKVAKGLVERGFPSSRLTILESLGGPHERVRTTTALDFAATGIADLNTLAIEVEPGPGARIVPTVPGLPDALFEHDGQLTKSAVRAITLSSLRPFPGDLLWDIGAGSGSIAIEWLLAHPANRAIALEKSAERCARIARNAEMLGTPSLKIVQGSAPDALVGLDSPDAIFIGGGVSDSDLVDAAWNALPSGGRLVANAVTIEAQAELTRRHNELGGELMAIAIARTEPVGRFRAFRPAMPVQQWSITRSAGAPAP